MQARIRWNEGMSFVAESGSGHAMVIDGAPAMFDHVLGPNLLDAMILAATGKDPGEMLEDEDVHVRTSRCGYSINLAH